MILCIGVVELLLLPHCIECIGGNLFIYNEWLLLRGFLRKVHRWRKFQTDFVAVCCFGADFGFFGVQPHLVCIFWIVWCFVETGTWFCFCFDFFFARICFIFLIFIDFVFCLGPILILILC